MNNRGVIICSESGIDGKDKRAMNEERSSNGCTPLPTPTTEVQLDPKTLADLINNSQTFLANNQGSVVTISNGDFAIDKQPFCHISEVLRQEWVVPSNKINKSIMEDNNPNGYVYVKSYSILSKLPVILVLCQEIKDTFSDGSFKIRYIPVNFDTVKRMTE